MPKETNYEALRKDCNGAGRNGICSRVVPCLVDNPS